MSYIEEYENTMICELKTSKKKEIFCVLHTIFLQSRNKFKVTRYLYHFISKIFRI